MKARYRVHFLGAAQADLVDTRHWLLQPGSGIRAHRRYADIIRALQDLKARPGRWPTGDHAFRERTVAGYRIVYRIEDHTAVVVVLRIFGPYQDRSIT